MHTNNHLIQSNSRNLQFIRVGKNKQSSSVQLTNISNHKVLFRVKIIPLFIVIPTFSMLDIHEVKNLKIYFTGNNKELVEEDYIITIESVVFDETSIEILNDDRTQFWKEKNNAIKYTIELYPQLDVATSAYGSDSKSVSNFSQINNLNSVQVRQNPNRNTEKIHGHQQEQNQPQQNRMTFGQLKPLSNQLEQKKELQDLSIQNFPETEIEEFNLQNQKNVQGPTITKQQQSNGNEMKLTIKHEQNLHKAIMVCIGGLLIGAYLKHVILQFY